MGALPSFAADMVIIIIGFRLIRFASSLKWGRYEEFQAEL
jgi:hypothetical protein